MQVRVGEEVFRSFRDEIREQLIDFKRMAFSNPPVRCALTGVVVEPHTSHVDHVYELWRLRDDFLRGVQGSLSQISVQPWREGEHRILFADRTFAVSWAAYHQRHAVLRITSSGANLSR